jgi:hypothetical protein
MDEQGNAEGLVRAATRFSAERPHWVRPSYDGFGLVNLPWSILASLGGAS